MKLNIGCGRVIFPLSRDNDVPYKAHLEPLHDSVFEPGWVNIDKYKNPGVDEVVNLFAFPWIRSSNGSPWNDDTVDEIYCGHIVEHIPHQVRVSTPMPLNWSKRYNEMVNEYDGFFVFFAEAYRILKPDGLIYIRCPYGMGTPALSDPTHTRYIVPGSFSYLAGQDGDAPFDYHLPMRFELSEPVRARFTMHGGKLIERMKTQEGISELEVEEEIYRSIDIVDEIRVVLRAIKE